MFLGLWQTTYPQQHPAFVSVLQDNFNCLEQSLLTVKTVCQDNSWHHFTYWHVVRKTNLGQFSAPATTQGIA